MIRARINKPRHPARQFRSGQQGISLIDAMIALVIFSVGMLALASLQTISKQSNYEAIQRTNATMYAYDLIERMRMNSDALTDYLGDSLIYDSNPPSLYDPCTSCSSATAIAGNDLYEWNDMVLGVNEKNSDPTPASVGGLVDPTACLTRVGTTNEFTLAIAWRGQAALPISGTPDNTCGSGVYDKNSSDYAYRRILVLNTFIGN